MLWLWIGLGIVAGVVVVPFVIGMLLRDDYEGTLTVRFERSPEDVWEAIADYESNPVSGIMRRSSTPLPDQDGLPSWVEDLGSTRVTVTTVESHAPRRLVRRMDDQVVPMTAHWTIEIEPAGDGSLVRAVNRTAIRSGSWQSPIFRLILRTSGGAEKVLREFFRSVAGDLGVTAQVVAPDAAA